MKRYLAVIKVAEGEKANVFSLKHDPVGGNRTFTVRLSASGSLPATHYWASGVLPDVDFTKFKADLVSTVVSWELWDMDGVPSRPKELLAELGLKSIGKVG